jgi:hypothetical protein
MFDTRHRGALPLLAALALAFPARAEEPEGSWYGHQTLLTDLGAIALVGAGGAIVERSSASGGLLIGAGVLTYLAGPAAVHGFGHANGGSAGRSVAWRVLAPLVGGLAFGLVGGLLIDGSHPRNDCSGCGAVVLGLGGMAAGYATAVIVDAASLAREPDPRASTLALAPIWSQERRGLALAMRF